MMSEQNPFKAPEAEIDHFKENSSDSGPEGLGGWLILVAILLVLTPIIIFVQVFMVHVPQFTTGAFDAISDPNHANHIPGLSTIILVEILGNIIFILFYLYLNFLFFSKSIRFPRLFIITRLSHFVFIIVDALVVYWVIGFTEGNVNEILIPLLVTFVLIAYLLKSVRVKNTFVN